MRAEETLRFLPLSDGKEPLFMWMMIPFLKIIQDPLFAGRILSVFCGLGTLIGVLFLSYLLFKSKRVALVAAILYTLSPYTLFFDRMALVDSMLAMFGIWTFILSYLAVTRERLDFALLAGFTLGGAWLTKSPALFFALMVPTLWLFVKSKKSLLKVIPLTLVTIVIGYGFYNILRLGPTFSLIASRNADYVWPISHLLVSPFDPLKPFLLQALQWVWKMGTGATLLLIAMGLASINRKTWKQTLVLFVWFLGPIFVQAEFAKVFTARYILFSIPYLAVLAGTSVIQIKIKGLQVASYALVMVFVIHSLVFDYFLLTNPSKANLPRSERSGYLEDWTAGQGIREIAGYIKSQGPVVVGTEGYFGTLPDGLQIYFDKYPDVTIIGTGLDFSKLPSQKIDYLVVNRSRFNGDAGKLGLTLVASYPKAVRPDGTSDSLLLMKVVRQK